MALIAYDVVRIVNPDHKTSYRVGRTLVESRMHEQDSLDDAAKWNEKASNGAFGYYYTVEAHYDLCSHRAPCERKLSDSDKAWIAEHKELIERCTAFCVCQKGK